MNKYYAMISGASKGIGLSLAREAAARGWNLALISLPDEGLEQVASRLEKQFGVNVRFLETDLAKPGMVREVADWCQRESLPLNMLINNAGLGYEADFTSYDASFYHQLLTVNVLVPTELSRRLLPILQQQHQAWILNISSLASFYPLPYKSVYAASKSYLTSFSEALRMELADDNVTVSVLCPAGVDTSEAKSRRINDLGWKAQRGRMSTDAVARKGFENLLKGKRLIIPGRFNRWVFFLSFLVPRKMKHWMIRRTVKKYRSPVTANRVPDRPCNEIMLEETPLERRDCR